MENDIFVVCYGINANGKKVDLSECSIVLGTLGECGLAFPVLRERFPSTINVGDRFLWDEVIRAEI